MSQENVWVVRAMAEALRSGETLRQLASGDLDFEFFDPEIEWDASRTANVMPDLSEVFGVMMGCEPSGGGGLRRGETFSSRFRM